MDKNSDKTGPNEDFLKKTPNKAFDLANEILSQNTPDAVDDLLKTVPLGTEMRLHVMNVLEEVVKTQIWEEYRDPASAKRVELLNLAYEADALGDEMALLRAQVLAETFFHVAWTKGEKAHPFFKAYERELKALPDEDFHSSVGLARAMLRALDKAQLETTPKALPPGPKRTVKKHGGDFNF